MDVRRWLPMDLPATRFDLELHAIEIGRGLIGKFVHNTALFDAATVARHGRTAWSRCCARSSPTRRGRCPSWTCSTPAERELVLDAWNDTGRGRSRPAHPARLVEAQVAAHARTRAAVTFERRAADLRASWTRRANRLAHRLRGARRRPGARWSACLRRALARAGRRRCSGC